MQLTTKESKSQNRISSRWYNEVGMLLAHIETLTVTHLSDSDLHILGIHISDMDLEDKSPQPYSTLNIQFFEPLAESKMPLSSCDSASFHAVLPAEKLRKLLNKKNDPYFLGRQLRNVIFVHEYALEEKIPSKWKSVE